MGSKESGMTELTHTHTHTQYKILINYISVKINKPIALHTRNINHDQDATYSRIIKLNAYPGQAGFTR